MTTAANETSTDAVSRYRYLLSTSSPEDIEKAHEEAFASMTSEERQVVLNALARNGEKPTSAASSALARSATRLEMKRPGSMSSLLGGTGSGATIIASLAAGFLGSAVWDGLTGGDGIGGRRGFLTRIFGGHGGPGGFGSYDRGPSGGFGGFGHWDRPDRGMGREGMGGPGGFGPGGPDQDRGFGGGPGGPGRF